MRYEFSFFFFAFDNLDGQKHIICGLIRTYEIFLMFWKRQKSRLKLKKDQNLYK